MHDPRKVGDSRGFRDFETDSALRQFLRFQLIDHILEEAIFAERCAREIDSNRISRFALAAAIGQLGKCRVDDPAIKRRHQIIALCRRNELVRPDQFTVFIAHPQQKLIVTTAFTTGFLYADDRLEIQLEPVFLDSTGYPRYPFHLLVPQRRIAVLVEMHLVAAHILRRVTGDIGGTHDACNVGTIAADHDHAYRTTNGGK